MSHSGFVVMRSWTPAKAAAAARRRICKIELLLREIGSLYGGIDEGVVHECGILISSLRGEDSLDQAIQYALDVEAGL